MSYCRNCQAERLADAAFCHVCGTAHDGDQSSAFGVSEPRRRARQAASETRRGKKSRKSKRPPRGAVMAASDEPERELWSDTFSAKGLVNYWVSLVVVSVGIPILAAISPIDPQMWPAIVVVIAAAWAGMVGWLIYLKLDVHYVLTNQRFFHRCGILTRHTRRIEVIDIDDISFRQGILELPLNVGTIELISSDRTDPVFELQGINNVREVAQAIDEARRAERLRRGLHIEAV